MAIAIFGHSSAWANKKCEANLVAAEGRPVTQEGRFTKRQLQENTIFQLGAGREGGYVYRLVPNDGRSPYVLKYYRKVENLENDLRAFEWVRRASSRTNEVKIAHYRRQGPLRMRLQDVRGRTLEDILLKADLPREVRDDLVNRFNDFLYSVYARLMNELDWDSLEISPPSDDRLLVKIYHGDEVTKIYLKPDNVIVEEKTLDLYLIDPY